MHYVSPPHSVVAVKVPRCATAQLAMSQQLCVCVCVCNTGLSLLHEQFSAENCYLVNHGTQRVVEFEYVLSDVSVSATAVYSDNIT